MRDEKRIQEVAGEIDDLAPTRYPGMTYEQGVKEALLWVLEEISDEEFGALSEEES